MHAISSEDFIWILQQQPAPLLIDVRSEGEFEEGHLPFSVNIPILNNAHRHLVGLCYKQQGNAEAVKLGYALVNPLKDALIEQWRQTLEATDSNNAFVYCWRGGQRSEIALQWMQEAGISVRKVTGGYKNIRNRLIAEFSEEAIVQRQYSLVLLGGMTGAGKTDVLKLLPEASVIDLEGFAHHRGSAFGGHVMEAQHSQQTFENALGIKLYEAQKVFLVEAESRNIGRCVIPPYFHCLMKDAPMVFLETSLTERAERIAREYVGNALCGGVAHGDIQDAMETSLLRVKQKLGGVYYNKILMLLKTAFSEEYKLENHIMWVYILLEEYYDKLYTHSIGKNNHRIVFKGNHEEVLAWWKASPNLGHSPPTLGHSCDTI
jgi:tRNA 2-selenouridine synthase